MLILVIVGDNIEQASYGDNDDLIRKLASYGCNQVEPNERQSHHCPVGRLVDTEKESHWCS